MLSIPNLVVLHWGFGWEMGMGMGLNGKQGAFDGSCLIESCECTE